MKSTIKRLMELSLERQGRKYPNVPRYALTTKNYHERNANGLTTCVIDWLRFHGWQAERINTTGRRIDDTHTYVDAAGKGRTVGSVKWIPTTGQKGSADISSTIAGRSVKIEIKHNKDRQSAAQKAYQEDIERSGGTYLIVRKLDEFVQWYHQFIKDNA